MNAEEIKAQIIEAFGQLGMIVTNYSHNEDDINVGTDDAYFQADLASDDDGNFWFQRIMPHDGHSLSIGYIVIPYPES